MDGFVLGGIRLIAHFDATQPFNPGHALHTGYHEAHWITIFRADHLAVHSVGDENFVIEDHFHRDGARHGGTISAFSQNIFASLQVGAAIFQ